MEHLGKLPPRETADALVYRCLDSMKPFLITIHAPTFKQEYLEFWENPESFPPAWLSLLYGILSCSIWMDHTTDSNVAGLSLPSDFEFYRIQSAAFLAKSDMAIPGKYKVEAAVVYLGMEYERTDNLKTDVSVLLGLVSRLAIVSGYHRDTQIHSQITIFEAEMRRRAWLTLLVTDCVVAYETGLPRVVPSGLGDAKRPRNLLDEDFDPYTLELPSARIATRACNRIIYMEKMNAILSMAADIADLTPDLASQPQKVASLCEQLNAIRDSIPTVLRIASTGSSIRDEKMAIWRSNLEMTYQRTCCVLHRPFLTKRTMDFQTQSFRETYIRVKLRTAIKFGSKLLAVFLTGSLLQW
ncbi:transcriptional regulator family: Fungal Specific TF [Trichoderma harzianum]|nr:transcriptional regulator family: Fungal Specific TF [Trichoderma harzianum]